MLTFVENKPFVEFCLCPSKTLIWTVHKKLESVIFVPGGDSQTLHIKSSAKI